MKNVDENKYQQIIQLQKLNNNSFTEHIRGSRKTLIVFGREVVSTVAGGNSLNLGNLSEKQFASFLGTFKKSLYNQFKKNPDLINLNVDYNGSSRSKNKRKFNELPINSIYFNLDISSAYWQMAYRLGYISKKYYEKYLHQDDYKSIKRLCFSFLSRTNYRQYFIEDNVYSISCNNDVEKKVYSNIRKELYKLISGAVNICGSEFIDYNIDAISVTSEKRREIVNYFAEQKIHIKIFPVEKVSTNQYVLKQMVRTF
jgi:hypothetical protein